MKFGLMMRAAWLALLAALLPAALASADPAAWRVTGLNGGEVTLLGSMHVLRPSDYPLPPTVDALIDGADDIRARSSRTSSTPTFIGSSRSTWASSAST